MCPGPGHRAAAENPCYHWLLRVLRICLFDRYARLAMGLMDNFTYADVIIVTRLLVAPVSEQSGSPGPYFRQVSECLISGH